MEIRSVVSPTNARPSVVERLPVEADETLEVYNFVVPMQIIRVIPAPHVHRSTIDNARYVTEARIHFGFPHFRIADIKREGADQKFFLPFYECNLQISPGTTAAS